jgi:hypothetical protein
VRKVLRGLMVLTAWMGLTVLGVLLAPQVESARQERQARRVRRESKALPDHLEAWVHRDRPAIPAHLAARVPSGPRVLPDHLVHRVNRAHRAR